jgi:hypothetical protein
MTELGTALREADVAEPVAPDVAERVLAAAAAALDASGAPRRWSDRLPPAPALAAAVLVVVVALVAGALARNGGGDRTALSAVDTLPFHGTYVTRRTGQPDATTEVWFRDTDHRRIEGPDGLVVTDGEHTLLHGGIVDDEREDDGSYVRNKYRRGFWDGPLSYWDENKCDTPEPVTDEPPVAVLGRPTRHLRCPATGGPPVDHWVDVATGLVLRRASGDVVQEVTSLELDPPSGSARRSSIRSAMW